MAQDPAMLSFLDAGVNVKGASNENFAREIMELFTMGVGHYTEKDIREAAPGLRHGARSRDVEHADLVYGNLEGLLVNSLGPDKDIPDKSGWQHIGPEAVEALKAANIKVVGVANNVA